MIRGNRNISRAAEEKLSESINTAVIECVHYILCREGSKIPIKRSEIKDHLTTNCRILQTDLNTIILEADKMLKLIYGLKLVQIAAKSGIQYIVVLVVPSENPLLSTIADTYHRKLLVAVLTHLFVAGGPVRDEVMWSFLDEAGILKESDNAGRKIITHLFTKQLYLKYVKVGENEFSRHVFEWGQRAVEELPTVFLLTKLSQAFERDPSEWMEQDEESSRNC